jgi:hypothetical protein
VANGNRPVAQGLKVNVNANAALAVAERTTFAITFDRTTTLR